MTASSFVIGIAGGTGAGKTTVARLIARRVGESVTRIPLDNYYEDQSHLPMEERDATNYDHPDAFEWELVREQVSTLLDGEAIEMPTYDFEIHNRTDETVRVEPTPVIIEGVIEQYLSTVKPMHERFVEPTRSHADLIVPEGANTVAVNVLQERIRAAVTGNDTWDESDNAIEDALADRIAIDNDG